MSNNPVLTARAQLSSLFTFGRMPSPDVEAAARTGLACANIDREVRRCAAVSPMLDDSQVGHLVGLILDCNGVSGDDSERLEAEVRAAVRAGQAAHPDTVAANRERTLVSLRDGSDR